MKDTEEFKCEIITSIDKDCFVNANVIRIEPTSTGAFKEFNQSGVGLAAKNRKYVSHWKELFENLR